MNLIIPQVAHVRKVVGECSDLLDLLDSALDSAEKACCNEELEDYASRVGALAART